MRYRGENSLAAQSSGSLNHKGVIGLGGCQDRQSACGRRPCAHVRVAFIPHVTRGVNGMNVVVRNCLPIASASIFRGTGRHHTWGLGDPGD